MHLQKKNPTKLTSLFSSSCIKKLYLRKWLWRTSIWLLWIQSQFFIHQWTWMLFLKVRIAYFFKELTSKMLSFEKNPSKIYFIGKPCLVYEISYKTYSLQLSYAWIMWKVKNQLNLNFLIFICQKSLSLKVIPGVQYLIIMNWKSICYISLDFNDIFEVKNW